MSPGDGKANRFIPPVWGDSNSVLLGKGLKWSKAANKIFPRLPTTR